MEERYIYSDLNEVPQRWKSYKGAKLSLDQINEIIDLAYLHKLEGEFGAIPDYGYARTLFEETHSVINNFWVSKGVANGFIN